MEQQRVVPMCLANLRLHLSRRPKGQMVHQMEERGKLFREKVCYPLESLKSIQMKDKINPANLVMCDLETGICEVPEATTEGRTNEVSPIVDLTAPKVDESSNKDASRNADTSTPHLNPEHNESNRTEPE